MLLRIRHIVFVSLAVTCLLVCPAWGEKIRTAVQSEGLDKVWVDSLVSSDSWVLEFFER